MTGRDNWRGAGRLPIVRFVGSDRPAWVERRHPRQTLVLALRPNRRSGPAGPQPEGRRIAHRSSQLGPSSGSRGRRGRCCGRLPRRRGWRLRRAPGWLAPSLRGRRRSLRSDCLNRRVCGPGLAWRSRLRRRSRRGGDWPRRGRRSGALDSGGLRGRGRRGGLGRRRRRRARLSGCRRGRRRGRRSGGRRRVLRPVSLLDLSDRRVQRLLLAGDVAFRQRRTQASELFEQRLTSAAIDRRARRRRTRVRQIGDGSHEQRMIISHKTSAQPLCMMRRRGPLVLKRIMHKNRIVALRTRR